MDLMLDKYDLWINNKSELCPNVFIQSVQTSSSIMENQIYILPLRPGSLHAL